MQQENMFVCYSIRGHGDEEDDDDDDAMMHMGKS